MSQRRGVVEKHYSARELAFLVGFDARYWRDRMKAEPKLTGSAGETVAQCLSISGEFFAPASWVNAYLDRHPLTYDAGVKARNKAELQRKLRSAPAAG